MITNYKIFEAKQTKDESIELFLKLYKKYKEYIYPRKIFLPTREIPEEIIEEAYLISYFYKHHKEYMSWHTSYSYYANKNAENNSEMLPISTFKSRIKKYIGDRIVNKWNKNNKIFYDIEKLDIIKYYKNSYALQQEDKLFANFLYRLMKKSPPDKITKIKRFNL